MSKLGNRTRNLLGKWKSHSQSVDIAGSGSVLDSDGMAIDTVGSDPCGLDGIVAPNGSQAPANSGAGGSGTGIGGAAAQNSAGSAGQVAPGVNGFNGDIKPGTAKAQWSEHVWSKSIL